MFNGDCASPYNFVKAAKDIVDMNIAMDVLPGIRDDPKFHFDAEFISESQDLLLQRYSQIISAATVQQQYQSARHGLGKSLHAIQKFYSHTNWIEMGNKDPNFGLGIPGSDIGSLAGAEEDTCIEESVISAKLTSGYNSFHYTDGQNISFPGDVKKCHHGGSLDVVSMEGINKDTSSSCFSPRSDLHKTASEMAVLATEHYINYIRSIIGQPNFLQLFSLGIGSNLVIVID